MGWATWPYLTNYDRYMLFIGIFGKTFLALQIAAMIKNKSSENVSFFSYIVYFVVSLSWLYFGIAHKDTVVVVSSLTAIVFALVAMNIVAVYRDSKSLD